MKTNRLKQLMLAAFVAITLLVGIDATANAQTVVVRQRPVIVYRRPFYRPFWGPNYVTVVDPIASAREQGFSDGRSAGKSDAKKGLANNAQSHKHYAKSDSETYRDAYLRGYSEGFREKRNDMLSESR